MFDLRRVVDPLPRSPAAPTAPGTWQDDPGLGAVAGAVAVLDDEVPVEFVAEVTRLAPEFVKNALEAMTRNGLLVRSRLHDPAVRSAVLASLTFDQHRTLRLRVAEAQYRRGEPDRVVAGHLLGAAGAVHHDLPWTAAVLSRVAETALTDDRVTPAAEYLRAAQSFRTAPAPKAALQAKLADVEWARNPEIALRYLPDLVDSARRDDLCPVGLATAVKQLLWHGRTTQAAELLGRLSPTDRPLTGYDAEKRRFTLLWAAANFPGLVRPATALATSAELSPAPAAPLLGSVNRAVRVTGALVEVLARGRRQAAVADAEHLLETTYPQGRNATGYGIALLAQEILIYSNELDRAAAWSQRFLTAGERTESRTLRALLQAAAATCAHRRGDLALAARLAGDAFDGLTATGWGVLIGAPLSTLIAANTAIGDYAAAAHHLSQPVPDALFQTRHGLHYLAARGRYLLATGRPGAALADFLFCGELMTTWGVDVPGLEPWRLGAARAWLDQGDLVAARRVIADQMTRLGTDDPRTRGAALRQLAAVSPLAQRRHILHEAVELLQDGGDHLELAYAVADLSHVESEQREHRRAWVLTRKAAQLAHECGATRLHEALTTTRSRTTTGAVPTSHPAVTTLTAGERRVATLAAEGYTNPEIAQRLFITRSTVEQHLTRIYRKLGIQRRNDLPMELTPPEPDATTATPFRVPDRTA